MVHPRYAPVLFGFVLSGLMSCLVSGLTTFRVLGLASGFGGAWMGNWMASWAMAFPIVLIVAPLTRRIVALLVVK